MTIVNISKPTSSMSNVSKVSQGETWGSIASTWASETRTWLAASQLMTNQSSYQNLWSDLVYPWLLALPWITTGGMVNQSKPV